MTVYPIRDVVPHRASLLLLDELVHWDDDSIHAALVVPSKGAFAGPDGVPAWIGIEYMAQAIGAYAGLRARRSGEPVRIGFLLGTRRYQSRWARFPAGSRLRVRVAHDYSAGSGLSVFGCRIVCGETEVAEASLTVFAPEDPARFLREGAA